MRWDEIRKIHPLTWLIIEAIDARTEDKKRIIEEMTVVGSFEDSVSALQRYLQLHKTHPNREMYVVHSSRPMLDIEEITWTGVRKK